MDFRSALPAAVLLGAALGTATVAVRGYDPEASIPVSLVSDAISASAPPVTHWDIPVVRNESVDRFVTLFSERQTDRMALYLKRSGQYEGMIREKLRSRGMPEDLLYLSMIESGFNPTARSKAQAVGLWQFIADTGRRYGLRIDGYVDERRDPEKSTDAALAYLNDLHGMFGSWYLAAAAYNSGEGRVGRVMREETGSMRGEENDFWRIRHRLPRETRDYVPLMVAAALVGKEPHKYGLGGVERYLPLETEAVDVPGGTDLGVVARAVGVSRDEIRTMNPQLVRGATPPNEVWAVRVPSGRAGVYAANFGAELEADRAAAQLRAAEAKLASAKAAAAKKPVRVAAKTPAKKDAAKRSHRVSKGESLWTIARRHNTSVAAIKRANGMGSRSTIRPGQRLSIPA